MVPIDPTPHLDEVTHAPSEAPFPPQRSGAVPASVQPTAERPTLPKVEDEDADPVIESGPVLHPTRSARAAELHS